MQLQNTLTSALTGAFMAAAVAGPAAAQRLDQFFGQLPHVFGESPIGQALGIPTVEQCSRQALRDVSDPETRIVRSQIPVAEGHRAIAQTRLSTFREDGEFRSGSMIILDRRQPVGPGSLTVISGRLSKSDTDLDLTSQPQGEGTFTKLDLDQADIEARGRFKNYSGLEARPETITAVRDRAFLLVDRLRDCLAP